MLRQTPKPTPLHTYRYLSATLPLFLAPLTRHWLLRWYALVPELFLFQAEDRIRDLTVTGVQTCALPILRTYPFIRLWHAGCATGEEVYCMAVLLEEEGLYERSRIYATDINEVVLQKAKAGIFPIERMQEYTENYIAAGGKRAFSDYYIAKYGGALFSPSLTRNVVFSQHNLVTDSSFSEFNVILCRNVLIYFDKSLQARVHELFYNSLAMFGVLALGSRESLRFSPYEDSYEQINGPEKIYRKVR